MTGARKGSGPKKNSKRSIGVDEGRSKLLSLLTFNLKGQNVVTNESPTVLVREEDTGNKNDVHRTRELLDHLSATNDSRSGQNYLTLSNAPSRWRDLSFQQICLRILLSRQNLGVLVSVLVHILLVLILLSIVISTKVGTLGNLTSLSFSSEAHKELSFVDAAGSSLDNVAFDVQPNFWESDVEQMLDKEVNEQIVHTIAAETTENSSYLNAPNVEEPLHGSSDASSEIPFYSKKGATGGRARGERGSGAPGRQGDVTKESEDAVERGLDWLARHQLPDGGWAFDLTEKDSNGREGACNGRCSNSSATSGGTDYKRSLHPSRTAATAIALLPFLGAGYTHTEVNKYQQTVAAGVRFLEYNAIISAGNGVDFRAGFTADGAAYIQALAVLTLCEAYEMTKDPNLKPLAQGGLKKIEDSQLNDGGWRYYSPGDLYFYSNVPGDTSTLGWQMLALKSGVSAGFSVRPSVAYRAGNFLDLVMSKDARSYCYQPNSKEKKSEMWGTTAVGVLMREYLGWEPGNAQLDAGIDQIADWIDDADSIWQKVKKGARGEKTRSGSITFFRDDRLVYNLYFSYYAALALHHYGGNVWKTRFEKQRDFLVETQARGGVFDNSCERGSWLFYDKYMNDGGRLLNTSLAILILETPYRYLPMYQ